MVEESGDTMQNFALKINQCNGGAVNEVCGAVTFAYTLGERPHTERLLRMHVQQKQNSAHYKYIHTVQSYVFKRIHGG